MILQSPTCLNYKTFASFPKLDFLCCGNTIFWQVNVFLARHFLQEQRPDVYLYLYCHLCLYCPRLTSSSFILFASTSPPLSVCLSVLVFVLPLFGSRAAFPLQRGKSTVGPGGVWEIRRHVRSLVGLFHTDPIQMCGWSPQRKSKHSPRSSPQVCIHRRQRWPSLQSDRQAQMKRSTHRVDCLARECNSVCSTLQWQVT